MAKFYFGDKENAETCYQLSRWKAYMKEHDLKELTLFEAEIITKQDYFYCKCYGEIGEVGEFCGKECQDYSPRNKVSGRCRHSGPLYTRSGVKKIIKL